MEENKNQEPKFFKVLRIVAPILLIAGICFIIATVSTYDGIGTTKWGLLAPGIILTFFAFPAFFIGFLPKMAKGMAKTNIYLTKEIQQEHKEDLREMANTSADISSEAITKTTRAIKKGIKDTKFCKHCGAEIDADSTFCKSCGKEQ